MARKRKTLPKNIEEMLESESVETLIGVFKTCDLNACGGVFKQPTLAFNSCPDELARWLVEQGADIHAPDRYGETPLHSRCGHWQGRLDVLLELGADVNHTAGGRGTPMHQAANLGNAEFVNKLLAHGAKHDARDKAGQTPLLSALYRCQNTSIPGFAGVAEILYPLGRDAGTYTDEELAEMRAHAKKIGETFEFHAEGFNPDTVGEHRAGLQKIYEIFGAAPAAPRRTYDGVSDITVSALDWQSAHQELWEWLVPSQGASQVMQGEVIRISGRLSQEIDGNGSVNWDQDFSRMADAFLAFVQSGEPLAGRDISDADQIIADAKQNCGDLPRLCELAVTWVRQNTTPIALPEINYSR